MITENQNPSKVMKAHSYFMKAEDKFGIKNYRGALEYYEKASQLFNDEISQLSPLSDKEIWKKELSLIELKINDIHKSLKLPMPESMTHSSHFSNYDELILSMRHSYPKTGIWSPKVVGLESVKQVLDELTIPLYRKDIWQVDEKPPSKALLFGPPGVGKTLLSQAFTEKTGLPRYDITPAKVISKWAGESEKILTRLFQKAYQEESGCILFFDEFDALAGSTHTDSEAMVRVKKGLLTLIDGIDVPSNKSIVLALTNRPDLLGGAMMRRFDLRIYVPPPEYDTIHHLLESLLNKLGIAIDFNSKAWHQIIASMLGFTQSEIASLVRRLIWKHYDMLVGSNSSEIFLRQKLSKSITQFTPYFANFDSLEPATFRFLDQAYGFPRSNHSTYSWEAKYLRFRHQLIQSHPNPNILYRRKQERRL